MPRDKRLPSKTPQHGDKVYVEGRKGALRVIGVKILNKEVALVLASQSDVQGKAESLKLRPDCTACAVIPVADVVRDFGRRGWRERWKQQDLFQKEAVP